MLFEYCYEGMDFNRSSVFQYFAILFFCQPSLDMAVLSLASKSL